MNPVVLAATIGVGGTVIVGVAGFSAAAWTTRKTVQLAREARIWDRRAEVYVDLLAAVSYRNDRRKNDMRTFRLDDESERKITAGLDAYAQPEWHTLNSRMLAFSSRQVIAAGKASSAAHERAKSAFQAWQSAADAARAQSAQPGPPPPGQAAANTGLLAAAQDARKDAEHADNAVLELIRTELQDKN